MAEPLTDKELAHLRMIMPEYVRLRKKRSDSPLPLGMERMLATVDKLKEEHYKRVDAVFDACKRAERAEAEVEQLRKALVDEDKTESRE